MIAKLRIEPQEYPNVFNVHLDDIDISQYVHSVKIEMQAGQLPKVWLEIVAVPDLVLPESLMALEEEE